MAEFKIFRSKHNADHYVAVLADDDGDNANGVRDSEILETFTSILDDGAHHLGFDPVAAKAAIRDHGFYAFVVLVEERDGLQELGL
jgi:UDP-glucose 6-dehydrogenase